MELIKINKENNTVSARELHEFLEIKTPFTKWFERMIDYGFDENSDFRLVRQKCQTNNPKNPTTTYIDYEITLDMAKELCMIQRSEKGKQARQYFINCEKKLKEVVKKPLTALEQLRLQYLAIDEQDKKINQVKADVKYLENNMPLFNIECKELQAVVRKKVAKFLEDITVMHIITILLDVKCMQIYKDNLKENLELPGMRLLKDNILIKLMKLYKTTNLQFV